MFTKYEHSREYRVVILNKSQHICKIGVMLSKYLFKSIEDKFRKVKLYFYAMIHLFFFQKTNQTWCMYFARPFPK